MATASHTTAGPGGKQDDEDVSALAEMRLNPEVLHDIELPGLEDIEVVLLVVHQPDPDWIRWTEGVSMHVFAAGVVAVIAFIAGRWLPF